MPPTHCAIFYPQQRPRAARFTRRSLERGFFPKTWLNESPNPTAIQLAEQPSPDCAPGVELATGSTRPTDCPLAPHGALGADLKRDFVYSSDERRRMQRRHRLKPRWFAPAQKLGNLAVIVDYNKWQATGRSNE